MESEDDCEVVLKDSELYKYLLHWNSVEFDVYDKNINIDSEKHFETTLRSPVTKVPTEFLKYLDIVLNSNLLLDEDVSYLYGFTVDLISDSKTPKCQELTVSCIIGICSLITTLKYNSLIGINDIVQSCWTVNNYYLKWYRTNALSALISVVKQLHFYFKKTLQILNEENAYFKLQQLKSISKEQANEFSLLENKKKVEVESLSSILSQCILDNINMTRDSTVNLIRKVPLIHPVDSKGHYLAFMSDDQLGISVNDKDTHCDSVPPLDTLMNLYLLMQSEFFRRLGLCFCPTLWSYQVPTDLMPTLFSFIKNCTSSCTRILSVMKFYYRKHVFPEVLSKQKSINTSLVDGYSSIHKISKSLSELATDSRVLEEFVENLNEIQERDIDAISNKLEELKKSLGKTVETVFAAEKYFLNLRKVKRHITKEEKCEPETENIKKYEIVDIGKTTHDIDSKDHVYFGITEGQNDNDYTDEPSDFEPVKLPTFLLCELKEALIVKRNEFTDRENKAVSDPDEYKKFLDIPETNTTENKRIVHELPDDFNPINFQLQKLIASAAAQRSSNFIIQNEEQFGSSDESDSA